MSTAPVTDFYSCITSRETLAADIAAGAASVARHRCAVGQIVTWQCDPLPNGMTQLFVSWPCDGEDDEREEARAA